MFIGPTLRVTVCYSLGFRLQTPSIPYECLLPQLVTVKELLT